MPKDPWDTPAMRQFVRFKEQHPGCVLFFRMGDFYEMFGEDAEQLGKALGLTVTKRGSPIPMCGVPHHQLTGYLRRAIRAGFRVAVCDQVQDPKDAKGVVDRAVTRVVTPGTLVDDELLSGEQTCAIAAIVEIEDDRFAAATIELSGGVFELFDAARTQIADELARRGVRELVYAEQNDGRPPAWARAAIDQNGLATTARPAWAFKPDEAAAVIKEQFAVAGVEGFGLDAGDPALAPAGALLAYLRETQGIGAEPTPAAEATTSGSEFQIQRRTLNHIRPPARVDRGHVCTLDAVSLRALEVERTIRAEGAGSVGRGSGVEGSLLGVFLAPADGSGSVVRSPAGKRLLRSWLIEPLSRAADIEPRQRAVATLIEDRRLSDELGEILGTIVDVPRIAARISLGRATPRDVVGLGASIAALQPISDLISGVEPLGSLGKRVASLADSLRDLAQRIQRECVDEPPASLRSGGLIRDGVDAELDEARSLQRDAGQWLADYQARLIEKYDLPSLKVGFNKVFGYYIELPSAQAKRAPEELDRKQTLKNAERFISPELREFERNATTAEARALERERTLFVALCESIAERVEAVAAAGQALAEIDVLRGLAEKAYRRAWVRPSVSDERVIDIEQGRHPVLDELIHATSGGDFVPNDASLGGPNPGLALITGPNMAGKSTYIRQNALLTLLASVGSYVPADRAMIGTCDRIFTRVGADDALHRGQSTFMVEMTETAAILNNATDRSLVILDEIGRGTSTLDGLSLAWAVVEMLAGNGSAPGPRTLFATHYHELTELEERAEGRVRNLRVTVREWGDEIVFVHRIEPGRAEGSYGVHVARLAGVPAEVTARAEEVLRTLSVEQAGRVKTEAVKPPAPTPNAQLGLFTEFIDHPAVDRLREIKIETLSPVSAFDELRRLIDLSRDGR